MRIHSIPFAKSVSSNGPDSEAVYRLLCHKKKRKKKRVGTGWVGVGLTSGLAVLRLCYNVLNLSLAFDIVDIGCFFFFFFFFFFFDGALCPQKPYDLLGTGKAGGGGGGAGTCHSAPTRKDRRDRQPPPEQQCYGGGDAANAKQLVYSANNCRFNTHTHTPAPPSCS